MKRPLLATVLAVGSIGVACANGPSGTTAGGGSGLAYQDAPGQVVVRISTGGGFVAATYALTQLPQFSLMGDGSAFTPAAIPEIYPGPAMAPLVSQRVTPDGIRAILALAQTDGLLGPDHDYTDMGSVGVADVGTTTITIVAAGLTHTFNFYALSELRDRPPAMSRAEFEARTAAQDFTARMGNLDWLPAGSTADPVPYEPKAVRVFVGAYEPDPDLNEPSVRWPLPVGLADFGESLHGASDGALGPSLPDRCGVVAGTDLATLLPLIQGATQHSPWRSGNRDYGLLLRPLLPDESGC